jgi:ATP synthase protein I
MGRYNPRATSSVWLTSSVPGPGERQRVTTKLPDYSRLTARGWTFKVITAQLAVALGIAALATVLGGVHAGYSALVGAVISVIPSFYLAVRMFRMDPSAPAERILRGMYLGETIKVLLTLALFVIALRLLDVDLLVVGLTYLASVAVYWLALLFPEKQARELGLRQAGPRE